MPDAEEYAPVPTRMSELAEQIKTLILEYRQEVADRVEDHKKEPSLPHLAQFYASFYLDLKDIEALIGKVRESKTYLAEKLIPKIMELNDTNSISLNSGWRVTGTHRVFTSMKDQDKARDWLREHGYEALIQETVNAQTLASLARELEEEGSELPDKLFTVTIRDNTTVAKLPKRKTA